ncbi:MAG: SpoVR family protein [Candidatus Woesearchaeota archaeon]
MKLLDQKTKGLMEDCKKRAKDNGLKFDDTTLEYIVSNQEMNVLEPKIGIPTLYDYWVDDVGIMKKKKVYSVLPHNANEQVLNTRPAVSLYNIDNPDWMNVMIFYHVLGHIDFFQNNIFFSNTWDYDFMQKALAGKRTMRKLRNEHGRWVDYAIEWSRNIDNLVRQPPAAKEEEVTGLSQKARYYFDVFLPNIEEAALSHITSELDRYNSIRGQSDVKSVAEQEETFFSKVSANNPEFDEMFRIFLEEHEEPAEDLMRFIERNSDKLQREENSWMKKVLNTVRDTSLYFRPQGQTKIMNEGWASFWHDRLFVEDPISKGNEAKYAVFNARVVSHRTGQVNPYAVGKTLFNHIKQKGDLGRLSLEYQMMKDIDDRSSFNDGSGRGDEISRKVMENYDDARFIREFLDQDYMDKERLWVIGQRYNIEKGVIEYYRKNRKAEDFRKAVSSQMYHRPDIDFEVKDLSHKFGSDCAKTLMLKHNFEGKPLKQDYIYRTLLGIESLWGAPVVLETRLPDDETSLGRYVEHIRSGRDPTEFVPDFKDYVYGIRDKELYEAEIDDKDDIFE